MKTSSGYRTLAVGLLVVMLVAGCGSGTKSVAPATKIGSCGVTHGNRIKAYGVDCTAALRMVNAYMSSGHEPSGFHCAASILLCYSGSQRMPENLNTRHWFRGYPVAFTGTAVKVLRLLRQGGMPVGAFKNYTAANDPNHLLGRPGQYISKVNFHDTRLPPVSGFDTEGGGSVETFKTPTDALNRYRYLHAIATSSPLFTEYEYLNGTVLLRLSKLLTPRQATAYQRALGRVVH